MKNTKLTKKLVVCGLALVSVGVTATTLSANQSNTVNAMSQESANKLNYQLVTSGHDAGFYLPNGSGQYAGLKALDVSVRFVDSQSGSVVGSYFVNKQTVSRGFTATLEEANIDTQQYGIAQTTANADFSNPISKNGASTGYYGSTYYDEVKSDDNKGNLTLTIPVVKYGSANTNTSKNVATVNYVSGYGIATWSNVQTNPQVTGHYLPTGSQWIVNTTVKGTDGRSWYLVGNNEWASEQYYDLANENSTQDLNGVLRVNYKPEYNINVWTEASTNSTAAKKVQHGSEYKVQSRKVVNGKTWYSIGNNQWIQGEYAILRSEQGRGNKFFQ